jgi:hypothetical protein
VSFTRSTSATTSWPGRSNPGMPHATGADESTGTFADTLTNVAALMNHRRGTCDKRIRARRTSCTVPKAAGQDDVKIAEDDVVRPAIIDVPGKRELTDAVCRATAWAIADGATRADGVAVARFEVAADQVP